MTIIADEYQLVRQIANEHNLATDDDPMPWKQPLRDLGAYALNTEGRNSFLRRDNVPVADHCWYIDRI